LEGLKRDLEKTERRARALRAAIAAYEAESGNITPPQPTVSKEPGRFLRRNGKPMRPFDVMEILLGEHQGKMPTKDLFDLTESGGAFAGKGDPESAFNLSIQRNVYFNKLIQIDANGKELTVEEIKQTWQKIKHLGSPSLRFPGITKLKTQADAR
jgi:hypothetical protein